jgi:hypothetical protein
MNSINLQAICEQRILILSTRPTILHRPSIMVGVSYGAPVLAAECLPTREWTCSLCAIKRSLRSMFFLILLPYKLKELRQVPVNDISGH